MRASRRYDEYIKCCIDGGADILISVAGFPIEFPALVDGSNVKFAPIFSSLKAIKVLL